MIWPFSRKVAQVEAKSLADPDAEILAAFGLPAAPGGVSAAVALTVPAVKAAVSVISEAAASTPVTVKRKVDGVEVDVPDHPAAKLLNGAANPWTSGYELIRDLTAQALTSDAGGLAWVNRPSGRLAEVIHYRPGSIEVEFDGKGTGEPSYRLASRRLKPADVIHVRSGFSKSPLSLASTAIGLAFHLEQYGSYLFQNGARPGGVLETPKPVGDGGVMKMLAGWRAAHEGGAKAGRTAVLYDGATYKPLSLTSTDAQYLENRQFQILEIARAFRVPPGMLFELTRNTWGNSEQQAKEFVAYTLTPWIRALEAAFNRALLTDAERSEYRVSFDVDDSSQADLTARATAISTLITAKVLNPNEARDWLGMPPREGGDAFENPAIQVAPTAASPEPANDNTKQGEAA